MPKVIIIYIIIYIYLEISEDLLTMFVESDNKKITFLLRKLICIYSRSLKKIMQKYFLKYYNIVTYLNYLDSIKHLRSKSMKKANIKNLDLIYSPYQLDGVTNFLLTPKKEDPNNIAYVMTPCYILEDDDNYNTYYNKRSNGLFPFSINPDLPLNLSGYNYNNPSLNYQRYNTTTGKNNLDYFNYYGHNKFNKPFSLNKSDSRKNRMGYNNNNKTNLNDGFYNNDLNNYGFLPKSTRNRKIGLKNNFGNNKQTKKITDYLNDNNFKNFMTNDLRNQKQKMPLNYKDKIEQNKKDYQKKLQYLNNENQNTKNSNFSLSQKKNSENNLLGKSTNTNNLTNQIITSLPNNEINETNPITNYTVSSWDIFYTNLQGKPNLNTSSKNKLNCFNPNNSNATSNRFKNVSTNYSNCQNSQIGFKNKDQFKKNDNKLNDNKKMSGGFKISNEVNEFYNDSFSHKNSNSSLINNISKMTMQSISDSKILEIANRYALETEEPYDNYQMANILYNRRRKNNSLKKYGNNRFRY